MSRTRSISTGRCYGRARVLKAWGLPRSTFYQRRRCEASPRPPARRGPKTRYTDEQLIGEIRRTVQTSPFHGEGHRKVWARLRLAGVQTTLRRVLRLMREDQLLAPRRQPQPVEPKRQKERSWPGGPTGCGVSTPRLASLSGMDKCPSLP